MQGAWISEFRGRDFVSEKPVTFAHSISLKALSLDHINRQSTTIAEIEKVLSQRSLSLPSLESCFHMIVMIAAIADLFFLTGRSDHSDRSDRSDHMETSL